MLPSLFSGGPGCYDFLSHRGLGRTLAPVQTVKMWTLGVILLGSHIRSQSHRARCWDRRKQTRYAPSWSRACFLSGLCYLCYASRDSAGFIEGIGTKTYIDQWNKMETPRNKLTHLCSVNLQQEGKNIMKKSTWCWEAGHVSQ